MSDEGNQVHSDGAPEPLSRRESVKLAAAILALGAGLGVPRQAFGLAPAATRVQVKFFKGATDGGALVGSLDLTDAVTTFLGSAAGARAQIKWYHVTAGELGSMDMPLMIQDKLVALSVKSPDE